MWRTMTGGIAIWLAATLCVNEVAHLLWRQFDPNLWLFDLRFMPPGLRSLLVLAALVPLVMYWLGRLPQRRGARLLHLTPIAVLLLVACRDAASYERLRLAGVIRSDDAVSLSMMLVAGLGALLVSMLAAQRKRMGRLGLAVSLGIAMTLAAALPWGLMTKFGQTDYRRPADVAVVFGARVYASGTPSAVLTDRVATACELYEQGLVRELVFSGGPGDGTTSEPQAMFNYAVNRGIPPEAITLDETGLDTRATVANFHAARSDQPRVLAVSHGYHLPRIKMTFAQAGTEVYTVPARQRWRIPAMPYMMAREVAAIGAYYLAW